MTRYTKVLWCNSKFLIHYETQDELIVKHHLQAFDKSRSSPALHDSLYDQTTGLIKSDLDIFDPEVDLLSRHLKHNPIPQPG